MRETMCQNPPPKAPLEPLVSGHRSEPPSRCGVGRWPLDQRETSLRPFQSEQPTKQGRPALGMGGGAHDDYPNCD